MSDILLFTAVGIALYLICDQLLLWLERLHGEPLPQRNVIFFVLILVLSLSSFSLLRSVLGEQGPQDDHQEQNAADGGNQPAEPH